MMVMFNIGTIFLNMVILFKASVKFPDSMASIRGVAAVFVGFWIVILFYFGGNMTVKAAANPFLIPIGLLSCQVLLIIVLALCKQLNI